MPQEQQRPRQPVARVDRADIPSGPGFFAAPRGFHISRAALAPTWAARAISSSSAGALSPRSSAFLWKSEASAAQSAPTSAAPCSGEPGEVPGGEQAWPRRAPPAAARRVRERASASVKSGPQLGPSAPASRAASTTARTRSGREGADLPEVDAVEVLGDVGVVGQHGGDAGGDVLLGEERVRAQRDDLVRRDPAGLAEEAGARGEQVVGGWASSGRSRRLSLSTAPRKFVGGSSTNRDQSAPGSPDCGSPGNFAGEQRHVHLVVGHDLGSRRRSATRARPLRGG